ncbi:hypothetical protein COU80_01080 [Candidatus Peregrinibacteria bacterium CG10_big_fil_rev_8_21_14_0_10_55_24]|nr:MAG: hypothetical protein COU80_01080 [Candidatus Peregrinibacteria bacterium CG10_big_fil_rev_8_21_14_0_10_55_24]
MAPPGQEAAKSPSTPEVPGAAPERGTEVLKPNVEAAKGADERLAQAGDKLKELGDRMKDVTQFAETQGVGDPVERTKAELEQAKQTLSAKQEGLGTKLQENQEEYAQVQAQLREDPQNPELQAKEKALAREVRDTQKELYGLQDSVKNGERKLEDLTDPPQNAQEAYMRDMNRAAEDMRDARSFGEVIANVFKIIQTFYALVEGRPYPQKDARQEMRNNQETRARLQAEMTGEPPQAESLVTKKTKEIETLTTEKGRAQASGIQVEQAKQELGNTQTQLDVIQKLISNLDKVDPDVATGKLKLKAGATIEGIDPVNLDKISLPGSGSLKQKLETLQGELTTKVEELQKKIAVRTPQQIDAEITRLSGEIATLNQWRGEAQQCVSAMNKCITEALAQVMGKKIPYLALIKASVGSDGVTPRLEAADNAAMVQLAQALEKQFGGIRAVGLEKSGDTYTVKDPKKLTSAIKQLVAGALRAELQKEQAAEGVAEAPSGAPEGTEPPAEAPAPTTEAAATPAAEVPTEESPARPPDAAPGEPAAAPAAEGETSEIPEGNADLRGLNSEQIRDKFVVRGEARESALPEGATYSIDTAARTVTVTVGDKQQIESWVPDFGEIASVNERDEFIALAFELALGEIQKNQE